MKKHLFFLSLLLTALSTTSSRAETLPITPSTMTLTLTDAIRLAIQNNLTIRIAQAGTEEARGRAMQSAAALLPQVTANLSQARVFKVNLESQGFPADLGFFPSLIGPFNTFDARVSLAQKFLDLNAWWKMEAGRQDRKAADFQLQLAREQVAAAAALAYLEAQRTIRAVGAAQADLNLSQSLLKLAKDQRDAGISTGIDLARANTNTAQEQLRLIRAQVTAYQTDLGLKRVVGIPLDTPLVLPPVAAFDAAQMPVLASAVSVAIRERPELLLADAKKQSDRLTLKATRAQHLPTIAGQANYGYSGTTPGNVARTGSISGMLSLPIFQGGAIRGQSLEAEGKYDESHSRYDDTRVQVEQDVRLAVQTVSAEADEVRTANQAADLSQKELRMARDRFAAGIGDNIQLLTAETSLSRALDDQVDAVARFDTARVNLASALGQAQRFQ